MWGWKTVERIVDPSISFTEAKAALVEAGFRLHISNPKHAVFKNPATESPWTRFSPEAENVAFELAVAEAHSGLCLQLRYDTFVFFDTGDLNELADELAARLDPVSAK
jgi:hypothetical protein